jgi:hypothetical protein
VERAACTSAYEEYLEGVRLNLKTVAFERAA